MAKVTPLTTPGEQHALAGMQQNLQFQKTMQDREKTRQAQFKLQGERLKHEAGEGERGRQAQSENYSRLNEANMARQMQAQENTAVQDKERMRLEDARKVLVMELGAKQWGLFGGGGGGGASGGSQTGTGGGAIGGAVSDNDHPLYLSEETITRRTEVEKKHMSNTAKLVAAEIAANTQYDNQGEVWQRHYGILRKNKVDLSELSTTFSDLARHEISGLLASILTTNTAAIYNLTIEPKSTTAWGGIANSIHAGLSGTTFPGQGRIREEDIVGGGVSPSRAASGEYGGGWYVGGGLLEGRELEDFRSIVEGTPYDDLSDSAKEMFDSGQSEDLKRNLPPVPEQRSFIGSAMDDPSQTLLAPRVSVDPASPDQALARVVQILSGMNLSGVMDDPKLKGLNVSDGLGRILRLGLQKKKMFTSGDTAGVENITNQMKAIAAEGSGMMGFALERILGSLQAQGSQFNSAIVGNLIQQDLGIDEQSLLGVGPDSPIYNQGISVMGPLTKDLSLLAAGINSDIQGEGVSLNSQKITAETLEEFEKLMGKMGKGLSEQDLVRWLEEENFPPVLIKAGIDYYNSGVSLGKTLTALDEQQKELNSQLDRNQRTWEIENREAGVAQYLDQIGDYEEGLEELYE